MATSIASQLQAIRSIVKADTDPLKRPFTRPSILFDAKEAADIDLDTLFNLALSGGVATGFKKPEEMEFETRLYISKGKRVVHVNWIQFSRSLLNHDDVFILDTKEKIFQFNGANSNIQERAKSLEVIQYLKETYHEGTCNVAIVDDGKLQAEGDSGEFWVIFGGFAPIGKKVLGDDDIVLDRTPGKLFNIGGSEVKDEITRFTKSTLENDKCYLMDCGAEVFVWVGRATQVDGRKAAMQGAEIGFGYETVEFKTNFESWPSAAAPQAENRGKVTALLKQQRTFSGCMQALPTSNEMARVDTCCVNHELSPVIADFDNTLTKFWVDGFKGHSSHTLLQQENPEYNAKRDELFNYYHPLEFDPEIPIDEKTKLMEEWWGKTLWNKKLCGLLIEGGLTYDAIRNSVAGAMIAFRKGERDVPILIFSAGLADIIEEVLRQKLHRTFKNVKIVSNRMKFDQNGNLVAFTGKLIHSLNKNEHALDMAASFHDNLVKLMSM
ncbi:unnamed protein product [Lactuca virosa]|uniref:5'-nucleotidase n=1 Tax=Lactuca virosa TaxID=75947 RepID=A0AAU9LJJ9_9ASTR|nr:unnamed protein product [Lactuca virosa]